MNNNVYLVDIILLASTDMVIVRLIKFVDALKNNYNFPTKIRKRNRFYNFFFWNVRRKFAFHC